MTNDVAADVALTLERLKALAGEAQANRAESASTRTSRVYCVTSTHSARSSQSRTCRSVLRRTAREAEANGSRH
jgi:hypothetical protein